jgi:hypothetical protein
LQPAAELYSAQRAPITNRRAGCKPAPRAFPMTRRTALKVALTAPLAARGAGMRPIRLGGPIFVNSDDPAVLAREHRRLGYSAAYCPTASAADHERARAIREAFAAADVVISEVGAWRNILDPDSRKRADNLSYVVERLRLAEAVGARCCVDIAGSFHPDLWYGPHPKNLSQEFFDATVENCRKIIDQVTPSNTKFSIEMMPWSLPDGPDAYLKGSGAILCRREKRQIVCLTSRWIRTTRQVRLARFPAPLPFDYPAYRF